MTSFKHLYDVTFVLLWCHVYAITLTCCNDIMLVLLYCHVIALMTSSWWWEDIKFPCWERHNNGMITSRWKTFTIVYLLYKWALTLGGRYQCMPGLQFNWIGYDQTRNYVVLWMYWNYSIQSSQTGDQSCSNPFPCCECSLTRHSKKVWNDPELYDNIVGIRNANLQCPKHPVCHCHCIVKNFGQRTLTMGGSITVWPTSCLTGLDLTKQVNLLLIQHKQSSCIQTK